MSKLRYIPLHTETTVQLKTLIAQHENQPGALLPLLHAVQAKFGYIPSDVVAPIARALNLSRAEVHGVVTYYHHFHEHKPGKHVIQICLAEACQSCGSEALLKQAETELGCTVHSTRADQAVTLEAVYCLGLCASSPAMQVGERLFGRIDNQKLRSLLNQLELSA